MRRYLIVALCAGLMGSGVPLPAMAQTASCPGGEAKTASGECVNPALAASLRQRSVLMSQPKISETTLPVLPTQDRTYPLPSEYNRYELTRGLFSTNPFPLSCHPRC